MEYTNETTAVVYHITNTIYANKIRLQEEKKVYNILTPCEVLMNRISDNPDDMYFTYSMEVMSEKFDEFDKDIIIYPDGTMEDLTSETNLLEITKKVIRIMAELKHAMVTQKQPNELSQFIFNYNIDRVMGMFSLDSVFGNDKYIPEDIYSTIKAIVNKYKWLGKIYKVSMESSGATISVDNPEELLKIRDRLVKVNRSELIKTIGKYKFYTTGGRILSFTDKDGKVNIEMKPIIPTEGFSSEF
jgi:hypothetical protein